jgi:hypothetical protein
MNIFKKVEKIDNVPVKNNIQILSYPAIEGEVRVIYDEYYRCQQPYKYKDGLWYLLDKDEYIKELVEQSLSQATLSSENGINRGLGGVKMSKKDVVYEDEVDNFKKIFKLLCKRGDIRLVNENYSNSEGRYFETSIMLDSEEILHHKMKWR